MKQAFLILSLFVFLFAEKENSSEEFLEITRLLEQMKSALENINSQKEKYEREGKVYLSVKIYDNIGKPGFVYFGSNVEIGGFFREKGIMFSGECGGGTTTMGGGLNIGLLFELPNNHLLVPGVSSGLWCAYNRAYYDNGGYAYVNNENYGDTYMFGGTFVKYLIGKKNKYFEISARAFMGKSEKYEKRWYEDSWYGGGGHWERDYIRDTFLVNANIACGITFLF